MGSASRSASSLVPQAARGRASRAAEQRTSRRTFRMGGSPWGSRAVGCPAAVAYSMPPLRWDRPPSETGGGGAAAAGGSRAGHWLPWPPPLVLRSGPMPLSDLLVLDLSRVLSGPYCSMYLGDYGARVIKVEKPGE